MKRKAMIAIMIAIAVVLGLFALPKWLLYGRQSAAKRVISFDLTQQLALSEEMDILDKLRLLIDSKVQTVELEITPIQTSEAKRILTEQISHLSSLGYCDGSIDLQELETEEYSVYSRVYIDAQRVLRVYRIETQGSVVLIDMQSHKILSLGSYANAWQRAEKAINATMNDAPIALQMPEVFAQYYNLQLEEPKWNEMYPQDEEVWKIVRCDLINEDGERVTFALHLNEFAYISWGPVSEEALAEAGGY